MELAVLSSRRSKDPSTQVGAVLVSPDNEHHFIGYNGFARGVEETPQRWERPTKYKFVVHAEQNAINRKLCCVKGWTCYTTCRPCERCASSLINAGITKVVYLSQTESSDNELTSQLFHETGVTEVRYQGELST